MKKLSKILLIDDSEATSQINKTILTEMDIADSVDIITDGKTALKYLSGKMTNGKPPAPELILLDIQMPEINGFEFLEKYSELSNESTNNMKTIIVILSDYLDYENFTKSKGFKFLGVLDHVRKPLDQEDVENLLEEHFT